MALADAASLTILHNSARVAVQSEEDLYLQEWLLNQKKISTCRSGCSIRRRSLLAGVTAQSEEDLYFQEWLLNQKKISTCRSGCSIRRRSLLEGVAAQSEEDFYLQEWLLKSEANFYLQSGYQIRSHFQEWLLNQKKVRSLLPGVAAQSEEGLYFQEWLLNQKKISTCRSGCSNQKPLPGLAAQSEGKYFFHHRNNLDINLMIKESYHLMDATPAEIHPQRLLSEFVPLTNGQYPIFNKYPKFIVDYQSQERERLHQEELEYLRERQITHEVEMEALRRRAEDEAWYQQQEHLRGAEQQRRQLLMDEEKRLLYQRQRLATVKRELKLKELQLLDAARRRFMKHQQDQRKMELKRLDDDIERKMCTRERETAAVMQDVEIKQMELEAQRRFYEQQLAKEQERERQEVKGELDANRKKVDLEEQMFWRLMETEADLKDQKLLEESLVKADRLCSETDWKIQALHKQQQDDLQRSKHYEEMLKLTEGIKDQEKQLHNVVKELETRKWAEASNRLVQLETEQLAKSTQDAERRKFLCTGSVQEVLAEDILLQTDQEYFERVRNPAMPMMKSVREEADAQKKPENVCLNDVSSSDSSAQFSLDRGRGDLENKERALMSEVRELRQKLASQARKKYPISCLPDTLWT
ncbi:TBC1 domain family member 31-like [Mantella aurantiaca]